MNLTLLGRYHERIGDQVSGSAAATLATRARAAAGMLAPATVARRWSSRRPRTGAMPRSSSTPGAWLTADSQHVVRPGRAMLFTSCIWGAALAGFGAVNSLPSSLALLAVAGAADVLSVVFRTTIVQLATPDSMRGRTSSAEFVIGAAFPEVGNFRAGLVASASSPGISAVAGGLAAVAGAGLIALTSPAFVRYRHAEGISNHPARP